MRKRLSGTTRIILPALALSLTALPALAVPASGAKTAQLDEIVVTAEQDELAKKTPAVVETRTAEDLKRVNGLETSDLFKQMPSVHVRKLYSGSTNQPMTIRANPTFATGRTLVLMDGARISNFLGTSNPPLWQMAAQEEVDHIDVIYGPFSAAHGGNSLGGTALITTKMPTKRMITFETGYNYQKAQEFQTKDNLSGGTAHVGYGDKKGDLAFMFWYDHLDCESRPISFKNSLVSSDSTLSGNPVSGYTYTFNSKNEPVYIFGSHGPRRTINDSAKLKLAYDLDAFSQLRFDVSFWQDNEKSDSPETYLYDASGQPVYSGNVDIDGRQYKLAESPYSEIVKQHLLYALKYTHKPADGFNLDLGFSYFDILDDQTATSTGAAPLAKHGGAGTVADNDGGWYTADLKVSRDLDWNGKHGVAIGYHFDHYDIDNETWKASDWKHDSSRTALNKGDKGETSTNALFIEDNWDLNNQWTLYLGSRCEWWKGYDASISKDNNSGILVNNELPDRSDKSFSPKLAATFKPADDWSIRYSVGGASRFPTIGEMYYGVMNPTTGILNVSNPDLKPESIIAQDITLTKTFGWHTETRLTFFQSDLEDAIWSQTDSYTGVTNYQNVEKVRTRGIEVSFNLRRLPLNGLALNGSLTCADSEILRNSAVPTSKGREFPRIPNYRAKLGLDYAPGERWFIGFSANYASRMYNTLDNSDHERGNGCMDDYLIFDTKAGYKITPQLTATLGVDNISDRLYHESHPFPNRTVFCNLKYVFTDK